MNNLAEIRLNGGWSVIQLFRETKNWKTPATAELHAEVIARLWFCGFSLPAMAFKES